MAVKNSIAAITAIPFNTAGLIPAVFLPINAGGLTHNCFILRIVNDSNVAVIVSYDGVNENDYVRADSDLILDLRKNFNDPEAFRKGTVVYVSGPAAGAGDVVLIGYYQPRI